MVVVIVVVEVEALRQVLISGPGPTQQQAPAAPAYLSPIASIDPLSSFPPNPASYE